VLAVGHEMRQSTLWGKAKELIAAGALGDPLYALIELWRRPVSARGRRLALRNRPRRQLDPRRTDPLFRPGAVVLSGCGRARVGLRAGQREARRPPGVARPLQRHGPISPAGVSRSSRSRSAAGNTIRRPRLSGTEGALWASWSGAMDRTFEPAFSLRLQRGETLEEFRFPGRRRGLRAGGSVRPFHRRRRDRHFPAATGEDGCWSVRMCLKAQQSVQLGTPIPL